VSGWTRFVVELDGRAVGLAGGGPSIGTDAGVLTSLWVDPAARGRRIGDRLIDAVVDWSKAKGFSRLLLWVAEGNAHAERLYERNGFTRTGEVIREPRPEFEMARALEPPNLRSGG
jgi:ribosomal protein S18 acetylase RimI-like enzyme